MGHPAENLTPSAYGRLIEGLLEQAAGYAMSIIRHRTDAEDAVQQAALRGLERLSLYDPRQPFKAWWFTVLHHCCIDQLRSRRPAVSLDPNSVSQQARHDPSWQSLAECLDRLEARHAEILRLRYFGGLTYDELSEALAIPKGTVMSRLHYARKALYTEMKDSEP